MLAWKEPLTTMTRRSLFAKTSSNERMGLDGGPDVILAVTSGTRWIHVVVRRKRILLLSILKVTEIESSIICYCNNIAESRAHQQVHVG